MSGRLEGKVAVVIGGGSGFGLATAESFAAEGATVVVAGRREALAKDVGERLGGMGVACDATDFDEIEALARTVVERYGTLDVSVNYAGYADSTSFRELQPENVAPMVDVQLTGALYVIQHMANAMAATGGGSVISVSSLTAQTPVAGHIAYAASKKGIEHATRVAAVEWGRDHVRCNCVAPHMIETEMTKEAFQNPLAIAALEHQTPLGRMGTVDDVASCVLFLASDESSYISGQTICVDGGASCQKLPTEADYALLATVRPELVPDA